MLQLELGDELETALHRRAKERGVAPSEIAIELMKPALATGHSKDQLSTEMIEVRRQAVEEILRLTKGCSLGLQGSGLTMREYMHMDHKY